MNPFPMRKTIRPLSSALRVTLLLFGLALGPAASVFAQSALPDRTADFVWGQANNATTNTANKGGISRDSLMGPNYTVVDSDGGVYITDRDNNRVLHYPKGSNTADFVYGQNGSFTTNTVNKGGLSETTLNIPGGLAVDASGGLFIADSSNHRVLHFPKGVANADFVYGQNGSFTTNTANKGGISETSLNIPNGLALDNNGGLYVGDQGNNRVLHYPKGSNIADNVYGQGGSFTTNTANKGGITDSSLSTPCCVAFDGAGGIYVSDLTNNRVLHFPAGSRTADRVYGQGSNQFTTGTANKGGISANGLSSPLHLAVDAAGGFFVAEGGNNRVVHFSQGSVTADAVYGQGGDFTTNKANKNGQIDFDGLNQPVGIAVDSAGNLYVADYLNNRELRYDAPAPAVPTITSISTTPNPAVAAQQFSFTITGTNFVPATAVVNFTGPNCTPCVAQLLPANTATQLGGSITLPAAGTYTVTVRNGAANPASNGMALIVSAAGSGSTSAFLRA